MKKTGLWRTLTVITVVLAVFAVTMTGVANSYAAMVNKALGIETSMLVRDQNAENVDSQYYKTAYSTLEELYQAKVSLIREIAAEGTILLKNEGNALPVTAKSVNLLGGDDLVYSTEHGGGHMSADTLAEATSLKAALEYHGLTVSTTADPGSTATFVVIGRVAGEGSDMPDDGLALTDEELARIQEAKSAGGSVIVITSGDYYPEMQTLQQDPEIDAIVHIGNVGYRGAYGLADVLTGKVSPSGKTVETVAADSHSSPAMMNFGNYTYSNGSSIMASQAKSYIVYAEGIYTDYKYYETRYEDVVLGQGNASSTVGTYASNGSWNYDDEVVYPFGYGLSYTTFVQEIVGEPVFDDTEHTAVVTVKVKNTGTVAGKEVVTLYAQSPYTDYDRENKIEKAAVQLVGFAKTGELQPGTEETVTITVNLQWLASYDYTNAKTYVMDAGDYYFALGNGAHEAVNNILAAKGCDVAGDASKVYRWTEAELDVMTYAVSVYTGAEITNRFDDADINYWQDTENQITYLSRNAWDTTYPATVELRASADMTAFLNDTKRYKNGEWSDTTARASAEAVTYVDAEINSNILSAVVMRGRAYDDELWDTLLDNLTIYEMQNLVANGRYFINELPSVSFPASTGSDSPIGLDTPYVYSAIDSNTGERTKISGSYMVKDGITDDEVDLSVMTASMFPSEPVLAATFNTELAYAEGEIFGEDGLYHGYSFTWGLGANLHRTPYGGRASEYYSADAVLTALMGAAETNGTNAKGHVMVVKHFAVNEQEQNRIGVATFLNEQALRENYLRAFEGIATYGEMKGLMTSYNRLGLMGTPAEYDLVTVVLREEWGSHSYVITDLNSPTAGLYDGNASIAAGTTMMMNNGTYDSESGSYVNTTLNVESIKNDPVLLRAVREACHRTLYNFVNSAAVNGLSSSDVIVNITPWWQSALQVANVVLCVAAAAMSMLYLISANMNKKEAKNHA